MGRNRLMEQQRERMNARRKRLKDAKAAKTPATKKSVTRDTSLDQSRKALARLTGGSTPATGDAATTRLNKFLKAKPPTAAKPPEKKPAVKAKPAEVKPSTSNTNSSSSGVYGNFLPSNPKLKSQPKPKPTNTGGGRNGRRGGSRANPGAAVRNKEAQARRRQEAREGSQRARDLNPNPISMPMSPAKNPKKGHRYKKPFGPVMVFDGKKYVRA